MSETRARKAGDTLGAAAIKLYPEPRSSRKKRNAQELVDVIREIIPRALEIGGSHALGYFMRTWDEAP
jgi:hypothetical protein